jgi:hypothetical protein
VEQNDLPVTTTDTDFIISNCLNAFNALSADILRENKYFILHLETAEVSTLSASEKELLAWLAESQATVISNECASIDQFRLDLTV